MGTPDTTKLLTKPRGKYSKQILYFILSTLVLCAPSLYNGYPLLFSDSGSYIFSAFTLEPPISRPIGYGLFIMVFSARLTLWSVVYFQSLIISVLMWESLRIVTRDRNLYILHFTSIVILMLVSSLSWYSCQIMPDIFTSGIILLFFILFFQYYCSFSSFHITATYQWFC